MVCTAGFWFAARVLRVSLSYDILNGPCIFKQLFNIGIVSCATSVSTTMVTAQNNVTVMYYHNKH